MSRIQYLLGKFTTKTCSREEFDELMQLLQTGENEELIRNNMRKFYNSLVSEVISDLHIDGQGDMVQNGEPVFEQAARPVFLRNALAIACTIAIVCIAGFFYYSRPVNKADNTKVISRIYTPAGSKTSVVLPDGTEVWLNSLSTLTYTTAAFNSGRREVSLIGEAMFKVKHDSLHPFLVHTKNFDVTDLGTVFNIQAYPEDNNAQASLISGSIEVTTKGTHSKKVTLVPNQRIIIQNDFIIHSDSKSRMTPTQSTQSIPSVTTVNEPTIKPILLSPQMSVAPDTAWLVNKLIFTDESFYDLALQMQRRYNVFITFRNEKAQSYKFTGRFEDEDIDDALKELQAIAPFSYKKSNNEIYIE
ncbi:MAG TPA: FecR domain-containing protein [Puia sp.]|nr:FecR domain-containing protein [Puia sp.]